MIAHIRGVVDAVYDEYAVVDVGGVGYQVFGPRSSLPKLRVGDAVKLHTHYHVREDAVALYGFLNAAERDLFVQLQSVSGIGPKGALALIGATDILALCRAIEAENIKFLVSLPGIGQKTAGRLVLELKGKLDMAGQRAGAETEPPSGPNLGSVASDVIAALLALGYNEKEARGVVRDLTGEIEQGSPLESLLRMCLQRLNRI